MSSCFPFLALVGEAAVACGVEASGHRLWEAVRGGGPRSTPPFGILRGACSAQGLVRRGEQCGQTEQGLPGAPEVFLSSAL